jgi:membrane-associated protease RseP (regulator of RpoE activity)
MTLIAKDEPGAVTLPATDPPEAPEPPEIGNSGGVARLLVGLAVITALFVLAGLGDLLLFIVILVVIVMLHELAHFATAKWSGMKVTEYFVGFGPRLWSMRRGETEYGVKAIPAGGYVKITGFTVTEEVAIEDEPRTYRQQPFWKRIIVASAGSAMHFLIAFVLALIVFFTWGVPTSSVNVAQVEKWHGVAHTPAALAGIKVGDTIVAINGKPLKNIDSVGDVVGRSVGKPVAVEIKRDGHLRTLEVTPRSGKGITVGGQALKNKGYLGVSLASGTETPTPVSGVSNSFDYIGTVTKEEVLGTIHLFSPSGLGSLFNQVSNSKVAAHDAQIGTAARPVSLVGIAGLGVEAQQAGLEALLLFLIAINIVFGLINMLPMLPLDGGHVAVAAYEWIRTKKGEAYYKADITKLFPVVAVFLALLAVLVFAGIFLDITHPVANPFGP